MPVGDVAAALGERRKALTQHDKVLLALAHAAAWTTRRVPYEDLVLQAWRDFPAEFSLRNHPEHPDASDIHKRLYQTLKPKGLVVSVGNKIFRLTERGVETARNLESAISGRTAQATPKRLGRSEETLIEQAMHSRAYVTWNAGEKDRLIDYDARMFFQFSTGTPVADRVLRARTTDEVFSRAIGLGVESARDLAALSRHLQEAFHHLFVDGEARRSAD